MPLDLKIVQSSESGALRGGTWPNPDYVSGEYNLIQRIYKNLLTNPGEDMFDPEWGSGLRAAVQSLSSQNISGARVAVIAAFRKCRDDIARSLQSTDPAEQLRDLRLEDISYNSGLTAWYCTVTVVTEASETTVNLSV